MSAGKFYSILIGSAVGFILLFILAMPPLIRLEDMWAHYWLAVPAC